MGRGLIASTLALQPTERGPAELAAADDHYLVVTAPHLIGEEVTHAEAILNRGRP